MHQPKELKTIRDFIRFASTLFHESVIYFGHGTHNAWDEATALVYQTLHLPYDLAPHWLSAQLTASECDKLFERIEQRIQKRIPVAYLTHEAYFANLAFFVDERVLIPRSSLGELIEKEFEPWIDISKINRVLDLCTGSGCIAIACAKTIPHAEVDASDISKDALSVARINVLRHHVSDQVKLIESDLFSNIPKQPYDLIISNPPYVAHAELLELPEEYLHEPQIGLSGGVTGLDLVLHILSHAVEYLTPDGFLIVEVGNTEQALMDLFPEVPFIWLPFEYGEGGVFLLSAAQVKEYHQRFQTETIT